MIFVLFLEGPDDVEGRAQKLHIGFNADGRIVKWSETLIHNTIPAWVTPVGVRVVVSRSVYKYWKTCLMADTQI